MKMKRTILSLAAAMGLIALGQSAQATNFIATDATFFTAPSDGTLTFTYLGSSAADLDIMFNNQMIFTNNTDTTHTASSIGDQRSFGVTAGQVYQLSLQNLTTGNTWYSAPGLNSDGIDHLDATNTFTDFGLGAYPNPPAPLLDTSLCAIPGRCFLGWEDLLGGTAQGSDRDFNDLVFAEQFLPNNRGGTPVPEPASLALFGTALVGLGAIKRRRNRRNDGAAV